MRRLTKLEIILIFTLGMSIYINYNMITDLNEKYQELVIVMAHYGEAVEKLVGYEPEEPKWNQHLEEVRQWFKSINTTNTIPVL